MKIKDTDLNLFIAFDVIYTEKNLTKSGQVLGITQPAVSNALARLRDLFNDELFIRTSRGMIPTPVANQLIGDIRNALSLIQNTISVSDKFDPSTAEMTFKISIGDTSEYRLLPLLIKELAEIAPKVKVETYLTPRKDAPRELASGAIDFSIDPPLQSDQQLKHEKIYQEDYVMIVREDHPILYKEKITIEDYLDLSHIHISNSKTGMGHVDMTLYKLGLTRDIYLRAQHFLVAPYIVEQSDMAITTTKGMPSIEI
jgi:Transcriptional regulator